MKTTEFFVEVKPNLNCEDDSPGGLFSSYESALNYIMLNKEYFLSASINGEEISLKNI